VKEEVKKEPEIIKSTTF